MAIIGIDLGTTNSLVSVYSEGKSILIPNAFQEYLTPSVVSIDEDNNIIVGKLAKERLITHPDKSAAGFKRLMGTLKKKKLGDKIFSAEELSSFVLRKLIEDAKEYLQEEVEEVIISVPAYFSDDQRWATKAAGALAGVKVERIINEPSAAALMLHQNNKDDRLYMVIDFGGGTLDISIVDAFDNVIEIIAVSGNNHLGGEDFNRAILDYFCVKNNLTMTNISKNELEILNEEIEKAKRTLDVKEETTIEVMIGNKQKSCVLTYQKLYSICKKLLEKIDVPIQKVLRDASQKISEIHDVVLVGGSCKMRLIKEYIECSLNRTVKIEINPDHAIALGCGVVAGIKQREEEIKDVLLSDICPYSLGIGLFDGSFSPIIERNSILPNSKENIYSTAFLGQKEISSTIYQGEERIAEENLKLGRFSIEVPYNKKEYETIKVRFTYDINGILEVHVMSITTGKVERKLIISQQNRMSKEQIDWKLKELQSLKIHPRENEKNKYLLEKANRLFIELVGEKRVWLSMCAREFESVLETQEQRAIENAYQIFEDQLNSIQIETINISNDDKGYVS